MKSWEALADDLLHEKTDLCARCDEARYKAAMESLAAFLEDYVENGFDDWYAAEMRLQVVK